jgi:uncharacterized protein (PEP-CTERM system associated)
MCGNMSMCTSRHSGVMGLVLGALAFASSGPAVAENWHWGASVSAEEAYTTNVNFAPQGAVGDFATTLAADVTVRGEGARVQLNGTVGASLLLYMKETQNNTITPRANLFGRVEAVENFAFVEASAIVSTQFLSPFGPQPGDLVNATNNRYTSQSYTVSPYVKGLLGSTNISYQVRDDNIWTVSSSFGDSTNRVPNTYANHLTAFAASGTRLIGWRVEYDGYYYDNGITTGVAGGNASYTTQIARAILSHQFDPQLSLSARIGYEDNRFPLTSSQGFVYGVGAQWNPTERTNVNGFWEDRFFGSSYSLQASHRLPNSALRASFTRGLSSYPQLALAIPAGTTVVQFLDAAFTTRIPDPAERAQAIDDFLARTGLPPTLASPVNFYAANITLQDAQNISFVVIGARNAITFTVFNVKSEQITGTGEVLPPQFQFGQNNTQTGIGLAYSHQITGLTNLSASATYSRTTLNNDTSTFDTKSNNGYFSIGLNTKFSPKTSGSAGVNYSLFKPYGGNNAPSTDALNIFAMISHTF